MRVIVTGGAGYIGAHTVRALDAAGHSVVILDDLVTGDADRVVGHPLVITDLARPEADAVLRDALAGADAVIHFAARKQVGESMRHPAAYWLDNVGSLARLLLAMEHAAVERLVFSSSAAVYGAADGFVDENSPTEPVSPYGQTKLAGEQLIAAASAAWGLRATSLRYFNVGGAGAPELADTEALNLIPIVIDRLERGEAPVINGDDYATPDGTCVRDYVHVVDVAEAHLAVLESDVPGHRVFNIGTGAGTSVREMVDRIARVAGGAPAPIIAPRRAGDPPLVVASVGAIRDAIGWTSRFGVDNIVRSAWGARSRRP